MRPWLALICIPSLAHADDDGEFDAREQCVDVSANVAFRAREILAGSPRTLRFCEPCGDKAPGKPERIGPVVDHETPGTNWFKLMRGDQRIDIAFLYVQVSDTIYSNVALMAGCEPLYVSPSLHVHATTDGALISPSAFPPELARAVAPPPPPPSPPPPPVPVVTAPAAPQVVVTTVSWVAFAGGAGAAFAVAALGVLGFAARRRRVDRLGRY